MDALDDYIKVVMYALMINLKLSEIVSCRR